MECDVLVIGCGPAGAAAARAAALKGAKTVVIEKNRTIGVPVRCAEGIGAYLLGKVPFRIPRNKFRWSIKGMRFYSDGLCLERTGSFWEGFTLDRDTFDQWLASLAAEAGAQILTETNAVSAEMHGDIVRTIEAVSKDRKLTIAAKSVVAADGPSSTMAEVMGFDVKRRNVGHVYSIEYSSAGCGNDHFEEIYLGDFTSVGYGYVFPKGGGVVNIGVGGEFDETRIRERFEEFVEMPGLRKKLAGARQGIEKSGPCPLDGYPKAVKGNVILAGDAANQNFKPFLEGVLPAVICGTMAGEVAAESNGMPERIAEFENRLDASLGELFAASDAAYAEMSRLFHSKVPIKHLLITGLSSGLLQLEELKSLEEVDATTLKKLLTARLNRG